MNINENKTSTKSFQHKPMSEINVTPLVDVMLVFVNYFYDYCPIINYGDYS